MHAIELICLILLLSYCVNYIWGVFLNRRIANVWLDAVRHPLADNFSVVGRVQKVTD